MILLITMIFSLTFTAKIGNSTLPKNIKLKRKIASVMVIDDEVNISLMQFKGRISSFYPTEPDNVFNNEGHGNSVASVVLFGNLAKKQELCPNVKIVSCRAFTGGKFDTARYLYCLKVAESMGVNYINISMQNGDFMPEEYESLRNLTNNGVKIVVSAGNNHIDYVKLASYPAAYDTDGTKDYFIGLNDNFKVVQALDTEGKLAYYSNVGAKAVSALGSVYTYDYSGKRILKEGTSFASPLYLHDMVMKEVCNEN